MNARIRKQPLIVLLSCLFVFFVGNILGQDLTKWVNPFIGTGGHGHTFPGATVPFGMVQLSPDTRIDNWDGSSGYHYSDDTIYGFSHTHLSGTGIPDGCDILLMPARETHIGGANEKDDPILNGYASKFDRASEHAEPGYYSVLLKDDNVRAELTTTRRVGLHRYTFNNAGKHHIVLDLKWRDKVTDSQFKLVGKNRIEGYRQSTSWAKNQKVFFVVEFSIPTDHHTVGQLPTRSRNLWRGKDLFVNINLDTKPQQQVLVKVAISYVSIEGARKNLDAELPHWDFDKVRADARGAWNKELSKIEVSGGTSDQTTNFYTALYHTLIHPNVFNDVDGRYLGHDRKVHQLRRGVAATQGRGETSKVKSPRRRVSESPSRDEEHYTVFSLWDTFRAAHPLYTIIDQKRTVDFINTFIRIYEQGGRLPVWELWGEETDTMIGYHAVSVIADAMAKGIEGFDYEKAYAAAKHSANLDHFGLKEYKRRGYISMEDEHESVSKTLEYAYNDSCIADMALFFAAKNMRESSSHPRGSSLSEAARAKGLAYFEDYKLYSDRAGNYKNLFDTSSGFMRPKKNGGWVTPFSPTDVSFNFTEGNSWQYSFFVPHDVAGLIGLYGGRDKLAAKLDELFTTDQKLTGRFQPDITGLIGQYAHGNEPSHHIPYLFNYAGQPWKTQKYVRRIMDEFYKNAPDGLIGNEDAGQMSAWYILSASGFYPVNPGEGTYAFGTPLFPEMRYKLENGKTFTIKANGVSDSNYYIASAKLNGLPHERAFINHSELMAGGILEFEMTDKPITSAFVNFPMSFSLTNSVAVPVITSERVFKNSTSVTIATVTPDSVIHYTTDGTKPTTASPVYRGPIRIDQSTTVKAIAIADKVTSLPAESVLIKRPNDWTVAIEHRYNRQYTGGGDDGLIDGIRGTLNFASGEWQGYQPYDLVATIDLQRQTTITELGGGFLQNARSWIWMPTRIEFETSLDGTTFTKAAEIKTDVAPDDMKEQIRDYVTKINPVTARYARIRAKNLGKIPAWHPGAGNDAFIFVDEVIVR